MGHKTNWITGKAEPWWEDRTCFYGQRRESRTTLSCFSSVTFHISPDTFNQHRVDVITAKRYCWHLALSFFLLSSVVPKEQVYSRECRDVNGEEENLHWSQNKQVNWLMNDVSLLMWGIFINIHYALMYTAVNWWATFKITPTVKVFVCLSQIRTDKEGGCGSANQELRKQRWDRNAVLKGNLTFLNSSHELLQVQ